MGPCGIAGFVPGPVLHHGPTEPLPYDSGLRGLSPRLLLHLPSNCTSHRVWQVPHGLDVTLPSAFNKGDSPIVNLLHTGGSCILIISSSVKDVIAPFLHDAFLCALVLSSVVSGNQVGIFAQGMVGNNQIDIILVFFNSKWSSALNLKATKD